MNEMLDEIEKIKLTKFDKIALEMAIEYIRARAEYKPFYSYHEGYAVLLEEVDELWKEIKKKNPNKKILRHESLQIGAMALAFISDLIDKTEEV